MDSKAMSLAVLVLGWACSNDLPPVEEALPLEDAAQRGDTSAEPGETGAQPGDKGAQPGDKGAQPGDTDAQPGDTDAQPGDTDAQPGDKGAQPDGVDNPSPPRGTGGTGGTSPIAAPTTQGAHECERNEPNDTENQACRIALGELVETDLAPTTDTADYFVFPVEAGTTYTLSVSMLSCVSSTLRISLSSLGSGQSITQLNGVTQYPGEPKFYEFTPQATGDELLAITGSSSCAYQFDIVSEDVEHDVDTFEPNNTWSTAAPLPDSLKITSDVSVPGDKYDYYAFRVTAGTTYTLSLSTAECVLGSLQLVAASFGTGEPVTQLNATQYADRFGFYEFTPQSSGEERLGLTASSGSCAYQLDVVEPSTLVRDALTLEPNNTPSTAAALGANPAVTADITPPNDPFDYYTFPVQAGSVYTLTFSTVGCLSTAFDLTATSPSGVAQLSERIYADTQKVYTLTATSSGDELFEVQGTSSCTYSFTIE